jgi:hypothetical protein
MLKKTIVEKFRDFMEASSDKSNKPMPMTKGEIATAVTKRKRKAATKKRSATKSSQKKKKDKKSKRA